MAAYTEAFQMNHDIDWFASVDGYMIHAASNCSIIPLGADDRDSIQRVRNYIASNLSIDNRQRIDINEDYVRYRFQQVLEFGVQNTENEFILFRNNYIASFMGMAELGFYSFDRHVNLTSDDLFDLENIYNPSYVLVAKPNKECESKIAFLPKLKVVRNGAFIKRHQQTDNNLFPNFDFIYKFL